MTTTTKIFNTLISLALVMLISNSTKAQCTWHQMIYDSFEYTTACPDVIAGTTYTAVPQTYTAHNGTHSLYLNMVNCVGGVGTCAGDTFYVRTIPVCGNTPMKISTWLTTTFSGPQCDVGIYIVDANNTLLASAPSIIPPYSTSWTQFQSGSFTPTTSTISFIMITNVGGGNGNDLSMDEFVVENCYDLTLGADTSVCNVQTVALNAGNYTSYLWSNGTTVNPLIASTPFTGNVSYLYSVAVTDANGCVFKSDTVVVQFHDCTTPVAHIASSDTGLCGSQCINFTDMSNNVPTDWTWWFPGSLTPTSNLQNPTNICYTDTGYYTVTLKACNIIGCDSITLSNFIHVAPQPVASIYQSNDTLYATPAASYKWYSTASGLVAGATGQSFFPLTAGNYYCIITDAAGCTASSNTIAITTGIAQIANGNAAFNFFPNPNNGLFQITASAFKSGTKQTLQIVDVLGRVVYTTEITQPVTQLNLAVADGIYNLQLITDAGITSAKIVIKR